MTRLVLCCLPLSGAITAVPAELQLQPITSTQLGGCYRVSRRWLVVNWWRLPRLCRRGLLPAASLFSPAEVQMAARRHCKTRTRDRVHATEQLEFVKLRNKKKKQCCGLFSFQRTDSPDC
jgi:hypothetical protein